MKLKQILMLLVAIGALCSSIGGVYAQTRRAVIVALGTYSDPDIRSLAPGGKMVDVEYIKIGLQHFGVQKENIVTLTDANADRASVMAALEKLRQDSKPGDAAIFYFSGHSGHAGDHFSLLPFDAHRTDDQLDIHDTDIAKWVNALQTNNVTIILDSCFTVYAVKDPAKRPKSVARDGQEKPLPFKRVIPLDKAVVLRASTWKQEAQEAYFEEAGGWLGCFTYALSYALIHANPETTYSQLNVAINTAMKDLVLAQFTQNKFVQTPEMDGDNAQISRPLFVAPKIVARMPILPPIPLPRYVTVTGGQNVVTLGEGKLGGVTVGSDYDVYPEQAQSFTADNRLGKIRIIDVKDRSASAQVLEGTVPAGSRASETHHVDPTLQQAAFTLKIETNENGVKQAIQQALNDPTLIQIVEQNGNLTVSIDKTPDGLQAKLYRGASNAPVPDQITSFVSKDPEELVEALRAYCNNLVVLRRLLGLQNPTPPFAIDLTFTPLTPPANDEPLPGTVSVGEKVNLKVATHNFDPNDVSDRAEGYYLYLVDIDSSNTPNVIFPNSVNPNNRYNCSLMLTMTAGLPTGPGTIIALMTKTPVNLKQIIDLIQNSGKAGRQLAADAQTGRKGFTVDAIQSLPTVEWAKAVGQYLIKPKQTIMPK